MNETTPYLPGLSPVAGKELCARFDGGRLALALQDLGHGFDRLHVSIPPCAAAVATTTPTDGRKATSAYSHERTFEPYGSAPSRGT